MSTAETRIKILLVEDDERLAKLTVRYLEGSGCLVRWASTGMEGLNEALRRPYDVILLDVMLPGMDGMDVCRNLRARLSVPIIMITVRGEEVDRVMGLNAGA